MLNIGQGTVAALTKDLAAGKISEEKALEEFIDNNLQCSFEQASRRFDESLGSGWFTNVCANVAHNYLMEGFNFRANWKQICRIRTGLDYRQVKATGFSGRPYLKGKAEHEPYAQANFLDAYEQYSPTEHGEIFSITHEAQANDQINAFNNWAREFGSAASRAIDRKVFYDILCESDGEGMTLADSTKLFTTAKGNRAHNLGAFSKTNLSTLVATMFDATGLDSEKLDLIPQTIVTDNDNYVVALEATTEVFGGAGATNINWGEPNVYGKNGAIPLQVIKSPYIVDGHYYLCAAKEAAPTIEVGFVGDSAEPELTMETPNAGISFSHHVSRFRVRIAFGATALSWQPFVHGKEASD